MARVPARMTGLLCAAVLGVTGCSFSQVDPDAVVHVTGRALDASGKPLADTQVLLVKEADLGEVVFGSVLAIGTLATICLLPDAPALCAKAVKTRTDADGRYSFDLTGEDTQGTLGTASTMDVTFTAGPGRTSTTVSFTAEKEDVRLPDARLWEPEPRVRDGRTIRLSWSPLRGAGTVTYSAQLYDPDGRSALWTQDASGSRATVDGRILEDHPGTVAVGATASLRGARGAGKVRAHYLSTRLPVRGVGGTPISRGRRCAAVTGTAPASDGRFTRCAATDGDLAAPAHVEGEGIVTGVAVDLGGRRPVGLVVGRGFAGQLLLEVSDDGRNYRVVATGSGTAVALTPNTRVSARYVRLRSPAGLDESLGHEVSVW